MSGMWISLCKSLYKARNGKAKPCGSFCLFWLRDQSNQHCVCLCIQLSPLLLSLIAEYVFRNPLCSAAPHITRYPTLYAPPATPAIANTTPQQASHHRSISSHLTC